LPALFFNRLQEAHRGALVMLDREPFGSIRVTPGERLGDTAVILRQLLEATGQHKAELAKSLVGIVQVFKERVEAGGVGCLPDELVKIAIHA
jgi:hypothetical protein